MTAELKCDEDLNTPHIACVMGTAAGGCADNNDASTRVQASSALPTEGVPAICTLEAKSRQPGDNLDAFIGQPRCGSLASDVGDGGARLSASSSAARDLALLRLADDVSSASDGPDSEQLEIGPDSASEGASSSGRRCHVPAPQSGQEGDATPADGQPSERPPVRRGSTGGAQQAAASNPEKVCDLILDMDAAAAAVSAALTGILGGQPPPPRKAASALDARHVGAGPLPPPPPPPPRRSASQYGYLNPAGGAAGGSGCGSGVFYPFPPLLSHPQLPPPPPPPRRYLRTLSQPAAIHHHHRQQQLQMAVMARTNLGTATATTLATTPLAPGHVTLGSTGVAGPTSCGRLGAMVPPLAPAPFGMRPSAAAAAGIAAGGGIFESPESYWPAFPSEQPRWRVSISGPTVDMAAAEGPAARRPPGRWHASSSGLPSDLPQLPPQYGGYAPPYAYPCAMSPPYVSAQCSSHQHPHQHQFAPPHGRSHPLLSPTSQPPQPQPSLHGRPTASRVLALSQPHHPNLPLQNGPGVLPHMQPTPHSPHLVPAPGVMLQQQQPQVPMVAQSQAQAMLLNHHPHLHHLHQQQQQQSFSAACGSHELVAEVGVGVGAGASELTLAGGVAVAGGDRTAMQAAFPSPSVPSGPMQQLLINSADLDLDAGVDLDLGLGLRGVAAGSLGAAQQLQGQREQQQQLNDYVATAFAASHQQQLLAAMAAAAWQEQGVLPEGLLLPGPHQHYCQHQEHQQQQAPEASGLTGPTHSALPDIAALFESQSGPALPGGTVTNGTADAAAEPSAAAAASTASTAPDWAWRVATGASDNQAGSDGGGAAQGSGSEGGAGPTVRGSRPREKPEDGEGEDAHLGTHPSHAGAGRDWPVQCDPAVAEGGEADNGEHVRQLGRCASEPARRAAEEGRQLYTSGLFSSFKDSVRGGAATAAAASGGGFAAPLTAAGLARLLEDDAGGFLGAAAAAAALGGWSGVDTDSVGSIGSSSALASLLESFGAGRSSSALSPLLEHRSSSTSCGFDLAGFSLSLHPSPRTSPANPLALRDELAAALTGAGGCVEVAAPGGGAAAAAAAAPPPPLGSQAAAVAAPMSLGPCAAVDEGAMQLLPGFQRLGQQQPGDKQLQDAVLAGAVGPSAVAAAAPGGPQPQLDSAAAAAAPCSLSLWDLHTALRILQATAHWDAQA